MKLLAVPRWSLNINLFMNVVPYVLPLHEQSFTITDHIFLEYLESSIGRRCRK